MTKLSVVGIFANLDEDALGDVERHINRKTYAAGAQIIEPEADSSDVYLILSGRVRIVNYSLSGREITLEEIGAGGCVGQLSAIDGEPRSACVFAVDDTDVGILSPANFEKVVKSHPSVAWNVISELARIVRTSTRRIVDVSTLGANERVIAEILRRAQQVCDDKGAATLSPVPVHSEVAGRVSTSRETVARVMGSLGRKGLVNKIDSGLHVPDVRRLEEFLSESIH
ncbi:MULTISPECIES: Crp/Fnr family transcriptional regulator [Thalassospira]|jgi:CRP-like cAMP-binding protein|uniref:Crp/Fnr family transcriptional regulator n=1 Tax=Thalassospira povalilytica TaxID=732237 RepID=A0A8I1M8C3_9PROT|nr:MULTISPECIES: Crp/Fnr family transcriptional regulator [Thalassospira]MEE3044766.1 Crp/Fnr family transcriptional regulator [Pseudomonadota bacterium]RCK27125.1 Crp/Fnr family transcriptional regulator [Thalassospira profundimaris]KZB60381.1 Crp/Fnr family transcriptional regulator [Thalassospira sp. MCCC 1A02491]MAL39613.1 Crp/Fnr family transcriptional regulator [Thalassospira sp.]MBN8197117.1 Crp/Fnr family transcriptional regulator [Thalassospira povalilytica]|tara:strand:+ start:136 stop:816 length:681 start_codon:yes stop_codon:yes gene_type:complete|eukprot:TRINITY_DN1060_c0_g1_i5.p1 TRINITY_DN1060_c0_g1~~TRINITY_DN1060_c0_g1_i5.p1  ORF type:complete len:227 (+),score=31.38 TRINITY_DN1060_c0_g1_i5:144-824(+)